MNLLLRIQLLVVDVRVVIEDDVDGVRIERNLVEDSERQSIAHNAATRRFSTQILGVQGCMLARCTCAENPYKLNSSRKNSSDTSQRNSFPFKRVHHSIQDCCAASSESSAESEKEGLRSMRLLRPGPDIARTPAELLIGATRG